MEFAGKVALVTGSAAGIGRAVVLELARQGAAVALADLDQVGTERVAAEIQAQGGRCMAYRVDVSQESGVAAAIADIVSRCGRLDMLVNAAGFLRYTPVAELSMADWKRMIEVHLMGTFLCCREALRPMKSQKAGSIVNFSSGLGAKGAKNAAHYAAAKAGIVGFTKSLAMEVAADGIRVNAVAPGPIDTALLRRDATEEEFAAEVRNREKTIPMGRIGVPEDLVGPCLFLLGEMSRYVTGQTIHINGGGFFLG
ncbi:MAG: SDR family oxidoreductase [Candidatus Tectomicrobia bacterium]|uniref:SDR family oxidoreductase n=1 Tax=Tectimicrobiota bacterium TaxID=2528274 RepID=A0A932GM62_UNCTE|nr:SDR family oxidoreductase [Candidatus Tectomicrobia bacterium]